MTKIPVGVNFTRSSAKRISNVVRSVEGSPLDMTGKSGRKPDILGGGSLRRFELKEDVTEDNATVTDDNAYRLDYNSTDEEYEINESSTFKLYSFIGFTGSGRVVDGEDVTDGTRGWCALKNGRWEVVGGDGGGSRISGLVSDGDVTGGFFDIDNISVISGSDPRTDPEDDEETVTIANPFGFTIDDGGYIHAEQKVSTGAYLCYQAECPSA